MWTLIHHILSNASNASDARVASDKQPGVRGYSCTCEQDPGPGAVVGDVQFVHPQDRGFDVVSAKLIESRNNIAESYGRQSCETAESSLLKSYLIVKIFSFKNFILKFFNFFHLHIVKLFAASSALGEVYAHFVNLSLEKSV